VSALNDTRGGAVDAANQMKPRQALSPSLGPTVEAPRRVQASEAAKLLTKSIRRLRDGPSFLSGARPSEPRIAGRRPALTERQDQRTLGGRRKNAGLAGMFRIDNLDGGPGAGGVGARLRARPASTSHAAPVTLARRPPPLMTFVSGGFFLFAGAVDSGEPAQSFVPSGPAYMRMQECRAANASA
jgi:hypothetical protein